MNYCNILKKGIKNLKNVLLLPYDYIVGKEVIRSIERYKNNKNDVIILLLKGIGDTVYGLAFLEAIKKQYHPQNIIVVGNKNQSELIMNYDNNIMLVTYDLKKGEYNKYSSLINCERRIKVVNDNRFFITDPYCYYYKSNKQNMSSAIDILRKYLFKLGDEAEITYPPIVTQKNSCIPNFDKEKSKIVVINPYSNSMESKRGIYQEMSELLAQKGFIVYTNVVDGQKKIEGTRELCCSIDELVYIVSNCAGIVSVRSGILDLIINTGTSIFAIYERCTTKFKKIYNLKAWNGKSSIYEVTDNVENDIMLKIFENWCEIELLKNKKEDTFES